jgi:hypothetical protein
MSLQRFLTVAFVVFVAGVVVLYSGFNRVPFRQNNHAPGHQQSHSSLTIDKYIGDEKGGRCG